MCDKIILLRHTVFEFYPICLSILFFGTPGIYIIYKSSELLVYSWQDTHLPVLVVIIQLIIIWLVPDWQLQHQTWWMKGQRLHRGHIQILYSWLCVKNWHLVVVVFGWVGFCMLIDHFINRFYHFINRFDYFINRFDHFINRFDHFILTIL